jgi:uncharacterized membrane protein YcaP (DUF421 family)
MKKACVTEADVMKPLVPIKASRCMSAIRYAIIERNGTISIIPEKD